MVAEQFKNRLEAELGGFKGHESALAIGSKFMEIIRKLIGEIDLSAISKDDLLKLVGDAYDKYILPIDLPGPDAILDPMLRALVLREVGKLYDKLSKPVVPPPSTAV